MKTRPKISGTEWLGWLLAIGLICWGINVAAEINQPDGQGTQIGADVTDHGTNPWQ